VHYGWVILGIGILVVVGALGFGRFGYGMLLPSMQLGLGLAHDETGIIASSNMFGYFTASMFAGMMASRYGPRLIISISLLWAGLTMALTSLAGGVGSLILLRFLTGVGSAGANVSIMGLSSSWFSSGYRGLVNGILVGGSGLAIVFVGWLVPTMDQLYMYCGWRISWFVMGFATLVFGILAALFIRNHPSEKGLTMIGRGKLRKENEVCANGNVIGIRNIFLDANMRILCLAYFCFGISSIIYTTYFVNYMVGERNIDQIMAGNIWSLVGLVSIGSAVIWGRFSDCFGRPLALSIIFVLQAISYFLPIISPIVLFMWVSGIVFGFTAWSIPGIVSACCGDLVGPKNSSAALGFLTFFFGLGTVFGPSLAGYIRELTYSFSLAFFLATLFSCFGGIISMRIRI
jgi:MFS family permease